MDTTLATNAIISEDDVKTYLTLTTDAHDAFIADGINMASAFIEGTIEGVVKQRVFTDILDGTGARMILAPRCPVVGLGAAGAGSLADLQYRDDVYGEWKNLITDVRQVIVRPDRRYALHLYDEVFPIGLQNVKLIARYGYDEDDPQYAEFRRICIEMVAEYVKESPRGGGRLGVASKSTSGPAGGSGTDSFMQLIFTRFIPLLESKRWVTP